MKSLYLILLIALTLFAGSSAKLASPSNDNVSMEERLQKLESTVSALTIQLEKEKQKSTILEEKLSSIMENMNSSLTAVDHVLRHSLRQTGSSQGVAFSSRLSHPLSGLGIRETLIFDTVVLNHRNGYNAGTGIFTAPVNGIYVFTWSTSNRAMDYQQTELVKQGQMQAVSFVDSKDHLTAVTTSIVLLSVSSGESVWIRTGSMGNNNICCNEYDSFSGWLLYST